MKSIVDDEQWREMGLPASIISNSDFKIWLTQVSDLARPKRPSNFHKGLAGRVLIIGGSPGMAGASILAAKAALAGGAGLVSVGTNRELFTILGVLHPCILSNPILDSPDDQISESLEAADVVVFGPGLTPNKRAAHIFGHVCSAGKPVILDAGALHLLPMSKVELPAQCILTPHPGEAAMLLGYSIEDVLKSPLENARHIFERFGAIAVLKTSRTVIDDGQNTYINTTGNPGMAVGGMGDVLTGILATQIIEDGFSAEACAKAVCLHGLAADEATGTLGERGIDPLDLIEALKRLWPKLEVE